MNSASAIDRIVMSAAEGGNWRPAVDPNSGRTYYYNDQTKKTQWDKPVSLMEGAELDEYNRAKDERERFFREMERNVLDRMSGIYVAQSKVIDINEFNDDGLDEMEQSPPLRTRTISTIDDEIFSYIRKRENSMDDLKVSKDDFYNSSEGKNSERSFESLHEQYKAAEHEFLSASGKSSNSSGKLSNPPSPARAPKLVRRNSTNTIFVNSTLSAQDNKATISCIAEVIRSHIVSAQKDNKPFSRRYQIFLDAAFQENAAEILARGASPRASPKSRASSPSLARSKSPFDGSEVKHQEEPAEFVPLPSKQEIETFFCQIFEESQLEGECIIMSLIYCEKLIKATKGKMSISVYNWKSILFACLVMSSKVWDDLSMWNCDFSSVCPSFNLQRVNDLELEILDILKYQIRVSASEYAKYYFHLRSMMIKLGLTNSLKNGGVAKPLDLAGAKSLQLATERLAEQTMTDVGRGGGLDSVADGGGRARSRTTAPLGVSSITRTKSNEPVGQASSGDNGAGATHTFIGLEELMHERHTDADGQVHRAQTDTGSSSASGGGKTSRK